MKLRLPALALTALMASAVAQLPETPSPATAPPRPANPTGPTAPRTGGGGTNNGNNNGNNNNNNGGSGNTNPRVNDGDNRTNFWDCSVPGGNFTVALGKITSVSIHEFNLTGGRVTEVNIDTDGSVCARFYFMEPLKIGGSFSATDVIKERLTETADTVAERTGSEKVWRKVQKDYPIATHAHTVEYRLQFKEDLAAIHASAKAAWMTGHGRSLRVVEPQQ